MSQLIWLVWSPVPVNTKTYIHGNHGSFVMCMACQGPDHSDPQCQGCAGDRGPGGWIGGWGAGEEIECVGSPGPAKLIG
jgi:hypothetical protein